MEIEADVIFPNAALYHLPTAQTARVDAHSNNGVTLVLNCKIAEHGGEVRPIYVQVIAPEARALGRMLIEAAEKSLSKPS